MDIDQADELSSSGDLSLLLPWNDKDDDTTDPLDRSDFAGESSNTSARFSWHSLRFSSGGSGGREAAMTCTTTGVKAAQDQMQQQADGIDCAS